jgi:hypothetical protein
VRGCLRGCLTLIGLVVLVVVGWAAYRSVVRPAPLLAPTVAAGEPPQAQALDARLASAQATIRQNAAAGRHVPVSLAVTDAELTAKINAAISQGDVQAPISDVRVNTVPGQMNISGQATKVAIISVPFTMTAVPRAAGGKAQLQVSSMQLAGMPMPAPLAAQLTGLVGTDNLLGDVPLTVTSFRAEQGRLVVEGTT